MPWSPVGEEAAAYSLARRKAAAVTRESGEVAACCLQAREKATAVTCTWAAPDAGQTETVAEAAAFSRPRYHARGARPVDLRATNNLLQPESIHKICITLY